MSVVAIGDNVVDCYTHTGWMYPGGNCVNVAVAAARSSMRSAYVGAFGTDRAGDVLRAALMAEGVDISHVRTVDGPNSHVLVSLVDGDRRFGSGSRGVRDFVPSPEELAFVSEFDIAHSSYCAGLESHLGSISEQARLSFDFDSRIRTDYAEAILPLTYLATFSAPGLSDADLLSVAQWAASKGPRFVLLTRGAQGAAFFDGTQLHHQPAIPTEVVDTLGAGDAFIGRVLVGIVSGETVPDFLAAAAAASSATCRVSGGFGHGAALPPVYQ